MQHCKSCGVEISADDRFCGLCGQTTDEAEAGKDLWGILPTTSLKSGERQFQSIDKETIVFDREKSSYTTPQYDPEVLYPTLLSRRSQISEFPTSYAEPWAWTPHTVDPITPTVGIGSGMQPASRRRSPILVVVTVAVVSAIIISGVMGYFLIKRESIPPPARLVVTPSALDFGELERSVKLTLSISISNTGGKPLSWTVTADVGSTKWLTIQTRSATVEPKSPHQQDKVTVNTIDLPLGPSLAYLTINSNGGNVQVKVKVDVIPPGTPKLNIIPTGLDFGTHAVAMPVPHQSIMVINGGTMILKWQANAGNGWWLTLDKNSSTSGMLQSGIHKEIDVAVKTGLTPGAYSDIVTITSNGGDKHVPVRLVVSSSALSLGPPTRGITPTSSRLVVNPTRLTFNVVQGKTETLAEMVSNSGGQPLNWSLDSTSLPGWLSVDTSSGTVQAGSSQPINVTATTSGLSSGSYSATLNFSSNGGNVQVPVTITVQ
jgi:hypothetical protein